MSHTQAGRAGRRQPIRILLGLLLLLGAGYAIGLKSLRLESGAALVLLGDGQLVSGAPAALRLVGLTPDGRAALALTDVELSLVRDQAEVLVAREPVHGPAVDLSLRPPAWGPGPASLRARVTTASGTVHLQAQVRLLPAPGQPGGKASQLRLSAPSEALAGEPRFEIQAADPDGEPAPAQLMAFPEGGRLAASGPTRVLVRVSDERGRPVPGSLRLGDGPGSRLDPGGLAMVVVPVGGPDPIRLHFQGPGGSLDAWLPMARDRADFELAARPRLVVAGQAVEIQVQARASTPLLYLTGRWSGGLCLADRLALEGGRGAAVVSIPKGIAGPLVLSLSPDPMDRQAQHRRQAVVWVSPQDPPKASQAFMDLTRLSPDGRVFQELSGLFTGERTSLVALLTRVQAPDGALPVLADSRQGEAPPVPGRRSVTARVALWLTGISSGLVWLTVLFWIGSGLRRRRLGLAAALVVALGLGLVLAGGWAWLLLSAR